MILVTGATGTVGGEVVHALVNRGDVVRALTRSASESNFQTGVERVAGNLDQPGTLAPALVGVSSVFLLGGYSDMSGVLSEIRRAGVQHVVLLSSGSAAGDDMSNAIASYHILSEAAVRGSGVAWTILRPSGFMSNAVRDWLPQLRAGDIVRAPFANVRIAVIDPQDIAAVAAEALGAPEHAGRTYMLTGPQALLPADQVRILGAALGRSLRFEAQSDAEARAEMSAMMDRKYVDALFSVFVDGTFDDSIVRPTVQEILGREPRTFEQWAVEHASAFG